MSDQTELNCLIVDNLPDLEAALHQADTVIEPMLAAEVERVVADFLRQHGWVGAMDGFDSLWLAPPEWRDPDGGDDDVICHFELDVVPQAARDSDWLWLSTLTGAGLTTAGFYWRSEAVRPAQLAKLVAAQPETIERLQQAGFVYDAANKRALYLPVLVDRAQLVAGLRAGNVDEAVEVFATAFDAAAAAVSLFKPLLAALAGEEE